MSRQDANAAFALSSFLQGTNAPYIDDIYARYEQDPASVDTEWQEFFRSLKDPPADVRKKLGHYTASLKMLEQVLAGHSLVRQLRFELEAFRAFPPGRSLLPVAQGGPA